MQLNEFGDLSRCAPPTTRPTCRSLCSSPRSASTSMGQTVLSRGSPGRYINQIRLRVRCGAAPDAQRTMDALSNGHFTIWRHAPSIITHINDDCGSFGGQPTARRNACDHRPLASLEVLTELHPMSPLYIGSRSLPQYATFSFRCTRSMSYNVDDRVYRGLRPYVISRIWYIIAQHSMALYSIA